MGYKASAELKDVSYGTKRYPAELTVQAPSPCNSRDPHPQTCSLSTSHPAYLPVPLCILHPPGAPCSFPYKAKYISIPSINFSPAAIKC